MILENRQHDSMGECKIKYSYEAVHINKDLYPPEDLDISECKKIVCEKINKIKGNRDYSILLDVILVKKDDKEINQVLKGKKILSHVLYQEYEEHCIPYTSYDENTKTFRKMWTEVIKGKQPRERSTLDGNVINKGFKQEIYGQLKIGV